MCVCVCVSVFRVEEWVRERYGMYLIRCVNANAYRKVSEIRIQVVCVRVCVCERERDVVSVCICESKTIKDCVC